MAAQSTPPRLRVGDRMTADPTCVQPHTPIADCARALQHTGVRHLPVLDPDGAPVGVVVDADVFARGGLIGVRDELWVTFDTVDEPLRATDVARPAIVANADDDLMNALTGLAGTADEAIIVVDASGRVIGIVTEHDVVALAVEILPDGLLAVDDAAVPVHAIDRSRRAAAAWELMQAQSIRHVIVTDAGKAVAVLSWRDLVAEGVPQEDRLRVHEAVHSTTLLRIDERTTLRAAAAAMVRHKVGCLPVVDAEGRPEAVLTRTDVLAAVVRHATTG